MNLAHVAGRKDLNIRLSDHVQMFKYRDYCNLTAYE